MQKKILWKIGGQAGFGIMTTGLSLSKIATRNGFNIFDYPEYPSLVRGGHNTYEINISPKEVFSTKKEIDILVCLNKETYYLHKSRLTPTSLVLFDKEDFVIEDEGFIKINLPFKQIIKEEEAQDIMINNIALGATLALLDWDFVLFEKTIEEEFKKKDEKIIKKNKQVASNGFYHIKRNYQQYIIKDFNKPEFKEKLVLTGNESHALGSILAGCKFHASYPMTPASSVLTVMAQFAEQTNCVVRHAEDEIAVISNALGASYAGVRSSVATSGGGFALMVESLSFAGIAEIPIVVFLAMRPGPATGMPTWTEQGDLMFALNSGHGEFPKIILAPGTATEMYELTAKAYDLADKYQLPVIILSDKFLSESHKSIDAESFRKINLEYKPNRGKILDKADENYLRYKDEKDGISPMLIPSFGQKFYQTNSYEHLEDGHTTEDTQERIKQVNKRKRKTNTFLTTDFCLPKTYGNVKKAKTILVTWGSQLSPALDALEQLGQDYALIHFSYIYPLDKKKLAKIFDNSKRYILIENNSEGQFGKLLKQEIGIDIEDKILKYDGRPIYMEEILHNIKN